MDKKIDYIIPRNPNRFSGRISAIYLAYLEATGISAKDYFLDPVTCAKMYKDGAVAVTELFGEKVINASPMTPYIAYGHISTLGGKLEFPDDGEVAVEPIYSTLEEGIKSLQQPVDFTKSGMVPFYIDFHKKLQEEFPGKKVGFAFSNSGPITSAFLLRGHDFMLDIYDAPDKVTEFLKLLVDSMLKFHHWKCDYLGSQPVSPSGGSLADDIAAMISPDSWETIVLPSWEQWFQGTTKGRRHAHCEDLSPAHLKYLEAINLASYDPFVSGKLNPEIIAHECQVPFHWGLPSFKYQAMTPDDVADMVYLAAHAGAEVLFSDIEGNMINRETVPKVHAFINACEKVENHLNKGGKREALISNITAESKQMYWEKWKGF